MNNETNIHKAVFGIYKSRGAAESAVDQLKAAGFRNSDVSVLLPSTEGTKDFAHEKATKAPEGATTGAASGAVLGGTLGWLVGMGIPEYEAKRYETFVRNGGILLSVHVDDSTLQKKAKEILSRSGAEKIDTESEVKGSSAQQSL